MKHGTRYAWVKKGCRCDECRQARQQEDRLRRQRRREKAAAGLIAVPHGRNGYQDYGCRCEVCSESHGAYEMKRRRAKGVQPRRSAPPEVKARALELVGSLGTHKTGEIVGWSYTAVRSWALEAGIDLKPKPVHGTRHSYARGCRCDACVTGSKAKHKANRDSMRARMKAGDPEVPHGTSSGYHNWGCRCEPCREQGAVTNKQNVERRKARLTGGSL